MANTVQWYGCALSMGDIYLLREALLSDIEGQRMKSRPKSTWRMQTEEDCSMFGLSSEDAIC